MTSMMSVNLAVYYAILATIVAFFAALFLVLWRMNRDSIAMIFSMIFGYFTIEMICFALLRSPNRIFPVELIGLVSRALWIPIIFSLVALADVYLAENNHHVSILARLSEWAKKFESWLMNRNEQRG